MLKLAQFRPTRFPRQKQFYSSAIDILPEDSYENSNNSNSYKYQHFTSLVPVKLATGAELEFLGTSSACSTSTRNVSSLVFHYRKPSKSILNSGSNYMQLEGYGCLTAVRGLSDKLLKVLFVSVESIPSLLHIYTAIMYEIVHSFIVGF